MLVERAKKGDVEAFNRLIEQNKLKMYKTAKAILKNEEDVADAIQETLISIYRNLINLKNDEYFTTWAIRITINKCYDIITKNQIYDKKVVKITQQMDMGEVIDGFDIEKSEIENILKDLDKELTEITILYYYDDLSVNEIAEILEIPTGTVKSRLARARNKLYEILMKKGGGENE